MNSALANRIAAPRVRDVVDVTSEDSFPASDPPSWTPVVGTGGPCRVGCWAGVNAAVVTGARGRTGLGELYDLATAARRAAGGRVLSVHLPARTRRPAPGPVESAGTSREEGRR